MFTPDELRAIRRALDYVDNELEFVDTRPPGWTQRRYTAAFCAAYDRSVGKLPGDFSADELTVIRDSLAVYTLAHLGTPEGSASADAREKTARLLASV